MSVQLPVVATARTSLEKWLHTKVKQGGIDLASLRSTLLTSEDVKKFGNLGREEWEDSESPLHLAARMGRGDMVRLMVEEAGFDVDSYSLVRVNNNNNNENNNNVELVIIGKGTCLHWAVFGNKVLTVRTLLQLGADSSLKGCFRGCSGTPLEWARRKGYADVVVVLEEHERAVENSRGDSLPSWMKQMCQTVLSVGGVHLKSLDQSSEGVKSSDSLDKMLSSKSAKEEQLSRAKRIQHKIDSLEKESKTLEKRKVEISNGIESLKSTNGYMTQGQRKTLKSELETIESLISNYKVNSDQGMSRNDDDNDGKSCPICFELAGQVFSCLVCENWICEGCQSQIESCPTCRQDFIAKPPKRNLGIERALARI